MENNKRQPTIFELLSLIDDFLLVKIISLMGAEQLLMFARVSKRNFPERQIQ
jgi:hypothetical protein